MSTDEVIRKAEARRAKLLLQKELRMSKILLGSKSVDEDEIKPGKENRLIDPSPKNSDNFIKEILTQAEETQLTQRKTDGAHFPRKVSLISSPANFKTLQQNQANKDGILPVYIYSFVISLHHYAYALLPLLSLIFFAVIGSFVQYNFLIPFMASQLVRIVHAFYNSPNGLAIKFTDVVSAIISHLIIFCTFYIVISVSRQKIYSY